MFMRTYSPEGDLTVSRLELGWVEPFRSNAYLVDDGDDLTLVDAGYPYNRHSIRDEIDEAGYRVEDIDQVVLTHYDLDHIGGLARISDDLEAPVYMGERDLSLMEGEYDPPLVHHKGLFHRGLRSLHSLPDELDLRPVADRDRVGTFTTYHTPGHNPGHMVYVHEELSAFAGDLVWGDEGESLSTPFWGDSYSMRRLDESVGEFARAVADLDSIFMGHGEPVVGGAAVELEELDRRLGPRVLNLF
jgi:glyoxylase-like metal-dependent hydrolase (beta-lactamase superfamily II)